MREIIDFYMQIGVDVWLSSNRSNLAHRSTPQDLAGIADAYEQRGFHLNAVCVLPFPSAADALYAEANDEVERAVRAPHPRFEGCPLAPLYSVVPGDPGSAAQLRKRLASGAPCLGVKLWPYMGRFTVPALLEDRALLELIREHRLLVSIHVGTGREVRSREVFADVLADPLTVAKVASSLPDITFHLGHLLRLSTGALERAQDLDNVFVDTSGLTTLGHWREEGRDVMPAEDAGAFASLPPVEILSQIANMRGFADKLVYGSNWPLCTWWQSHPLQEVELVARTGLPEQTLYKIFFANAARLLGSLGTHPVKKVAAVGRSESQLGFERG